MVVKTTKKVETRARKARAPKFEYIVNLSSINSASDVAYEFAMAKVRAGIPIRIDEAQAIEYTGAVCVFDTVCDIIENINACTTVINDDKLANKLADVFFQYTNKKKPWYKRFWNWITKPFKRNK